MAKKPSSTFLLSTLFAVKLCILFVVIQLSSQLILTNSPLLDVHVNGISYWWILIVLTGGALLALLLDFCLILCTFIKKYSFVKKIVVLDAVTQLLFFTPLLVTGIIVFARLKESSVVADWTDGFELMEVAVNNRNDTFELIDDVNMFEVVQVAKWTVDNVQRKLKCCGFNDPSDWIKRYSGLSSDFNETLSGDVLWWSNVSEPVVVPSSCCVHDAKAICSHASFNASDKVFPFRPYRANRGCWHTAFGFVWRFGLGTCVFFLALVLLSIPRDVWLYRIIEIRRRVARALECRRHIQQLRDNATKMNAIEAIPLAEWLSLQVKTESTQESASDSASTAKYP